MGPLILHSKTSLIHTVFIKKWEEGEKEERKDVNVHNENQRVQ